jgi:hypothetical protein
MHLRLHLLLLLALLTQVLLPLLRAIGQRALLLLPLAPPGSF